MPTRNNETPEVVAARLTAYVDDLEIYSDKFCKQALSQVRRKFTFFPSIAELDKFFSEFKLDDEFTPSSLPYFEPPAGMQAEFDEFSKRIGAAAYRAWFKGCKSWIKIDGEIVLDFPTPFKARWVRENYAATLSEITGRRVIIEGDPSAAPVVPTHECWWQCHDIKSGQRIAEPRDIEAERAEIQARLDAGESWVMEVA